MRLVGDIWVEGETVFLFAGAVLGELYRAAGFVSASAGIQSEAMADMVASWSQYREQDEPRWLANVSKPRRIVPKSSKNL